ncbi:similar to Saccharomyces cerevisiae YOL077W-A ATP19 Subunit k of the mitochondrial F1F0 ATP synthase, which is a large enzyme complex required for ATP synthesis [Maudiozyma barnettii]|uniref:Similar to Saccharomyces cerevisiae YOL077W-A ATP19 Subunit k of the mitochondrial F1F0 ATP synthase, which is a large enzyme complex required for ATP synthesis n=1 Tax=Maudiozyma barnettii TaxID=61262 RepID=A0A8H2VKX3_9SACH|nr:F1F0 ATP synthase subunit k [Kazachstania barnettii]CAB4257219.1 similar to Saccharomyces cerevisiae YOL077W-A ATP19 Subunit k of the mitochondrial F1F0 ATP synthase, which is a large enzyme complex required for ATP synthesis [Kazachstania barnettii]CAD1779589.1 similar to Saccharomyces cerevisiae YOL077W-A ATP19 Subunit k of the mitochondrial F1F0 ATP synthase, which is a large enzyme complex required for ATP synthesis [Kazachstania barnettii]
MGSAYKIFGRTFQPHQLAIATLATVAVIAAPNPFAAKKPKVAEIKAESAEEEAFIKAYIEKHSTEAKAA